MFMNTFIHEQDLLVRLLAEGEEAVEQKLLEWNSSARTSMRQTYFQMSIMRDMIELATYACSKEYATKGVLPTMRSFFAFLERTESNKAVMEWGGADRCVETYQSIKGGDRGKVVAFRTGLVAWLTPYDVEKFLMVKWSAASEERNDLLASAEKAGGRKRKQPNTPDGSTARATTSSGSRALVCVHRHSCRVHEHIDM